MMAVHMMSTFKAATYHQIAASEIWARWESGASL
jgi:hypothetical protein